MSKSVKGLVLKDVKLIISQMKLLLVVMVIWAIFMAGSMRMTFFVGYVAILCSFLTLSTVNFDRRRMDLRICLHCQYQERIMFLKSIYLDFC